MLVPDTSVDVVVNGVARPLPPGTTVRELVAQLGLEGKRIAVERNGEIVPRSRYGATIVGAGDSIEIVGAVGGG